MEFDAEIWKQKAWARYTRRVQTGRAGKADETNWAFEVLAIRDLYLLVDWCSSHKLKVSFAKKSNGEYHSYDKQIIVSSHLNPRKQAVVLLHECGHHLIDGQDIQDRFALGYSQVDPEIIKTFPHRLACLEEEFEAWHRGWKLAKRLNLTVDRNYFDEYRIKCLNSYIKWSIDPKKFKDLNE